jgi:hypothetical protein
MGLSRMKSNLFTFFFWHNIIMKKSKKKESDMIYWKWFFSQCCFLSDQLFVCERFLSWKKSNKEDCNFESRDAPVVFLENICSCKKKGKGLIVTTTIMLLFHWLIWCCWKKPKSFSFYLECHSFFYLTILQAQFCLQENICLQGEFVKNMKMFFFIFGRIHVFEKYLDLRLNIISWYMSRHIHNSELLFVWKN